MSKELNIRQLYRHLFTLARIEAAENISACPQILNAAEEVQTPEIITTVMHAVSSARQQIYMTMLLSEEREKPLPHTYHELLKQKLTEGIKIVRVGFGSREDFGFISRNIGLDSTNFTFIWHSDTTAYQRFIMVDKTLLFFNFGGTFYRSSNPEVIRQFLNYFTKVSSLGA